MDDNYDIKVDFCILGTQLSPDELTDIFGIKPSRTWLLGDSVNNTLIKRKYNGWCLSPSATNIDMEEQILSILSILTPKAEIISSISQKHELECEFACSIDIVNNAYPPLHLCEKTISEMSKIGASIDIDIM